MKLATFQHAGRTLYGVVQGAHYLLPSDDFLRKHPDLQSVLAAQALRARVAAELKTTFASQYARTVSLAEALSADAIAFYGPRNTGAKVLIDPSMG